MNAAVRWMMTSPGAPLVSAEFNPSPGPDEVGGCPPELYPAALDMVLSGRVKVAPFVEKHPLDEINQIFEAVHHGELKRRAVLVPTH